MEGFVGDGGVEGGVSERVGGSRETRILEYLQRPNASNGFIFLQEHLNQ